MQGIKLETFPWDKILKKEKKQLFRGGEEIETTLCYLLTRGFLGEVGGFFSPELCSGSTTLWRSQVSAP